MCDQNVKWSSRNLQYRTGLGCVVCKWYWMSNLLVRTQAKHLMQRVRLHPRFTTLYLSELFCEPRLRLSCLNLTQLQPKRWQKTSVTNNQLVSLYANVLHSEEAPAKREPWHKNNQSFDEYWISLRIWSYSWGASEALFTRIQLGSCLISWFSYHW